MYNFFPLFSGSKIYSTLLFSQQAPENGVRLAHHCARSSIYRVYLFSIHYARVLALAHYL